MEPVKIPPRLICIENFEKKERKVRDTQSNHILYFDNINESKIAVQMNQKFQKLYVNNVKNSVFQVLDSAVIMSRSAEFVDCHNCEITFDEVDVRTLHFYNCSNITLNFSDSETLIENFKMYWHGPGSLSNKVQRTIIRPFSDPNKNLVMPLDLIASFDVPNAEKEDQILISQLVGGKTLTSTLVTPTSSCQDGETKEVSRKMEHVRQEIERRKGETEDFKAAFPPYVLEKLYAREFDELEEEEAVLQQHVENVATAMKYGKHVVVYTGAGVSTSASLPDYRGPQGVWTLLATGGIRSKPSVQLGEAWPTYTHFALVELIQKGYVHYVTSTNLDGLHRRSGVPAKNIAELHGNCYREICKTCGKEYLRHYNVLETRQERWSHLTGRTCVCGGPLIDTIVHFTENVPVSEWNPAVKHARESDVALVLGTSMNVQPAASLPDNALKNPNGKMFIVNLQRTPYDEFATEKIYAKTDRFMELLMKKLGLEEFDRSYDHVAHLESIERWTSYKRIATYTTVAVVLVAVATRFAFLARFT